MVAAASPDENGSPVQPVRVFIVNDHALARQGLGEVLEHAGFQIAGGSASVSEALRLIPHLKPDVALVDDRLPDGTGIEVCRELRSLAPEVKCLMLTGWDDQHAVRAVVLAGASGYVPKQVGDNAALVDGIRTAAVGRSLFQPGVRENVAETLSAAASSSSWPQALTSRERSVLSFMARGLTNRQIGQELTLDDETVAGCVSSVLQKLGFRRLAQSTTPAARSEEHQR